MKMCCHSLGGDNMQIGIIGAGKVGCSVGKYLQENDALRKAGYHITGYAGRRKESVEEAATFTGTTPFYLLSELVEKNDIVCIATPDSQIKTVWEQLCKFSLEGKIVCHFSGSLSSDLFTGREKKGVSACSVHPMYAFSNRFTSYEQLNTVKLTIEGDPEAVAVFREIWNLCGNETGVVSTEKKMQYHAAAAIASNLMIGLYAKSVRLLEDCGFAGEEAEKFLRPLVENNIRRMLESSPEEALSGPVERNDVETVQKHLQTLQGSDRTVYLALSEEVLSVAKKKNPQRDYKELERLLREDRRQ